MTSAAAGSLLAKLLMHGDVGAPLGAPPIIAWTNEVRASIETRPEGDGRSLWLGGFQRALTYS